VGRETYFKINFNPLLNTIESETTADSITLSGRIDRIDADDSENLVIIDYKSSLQTKHTLGRWLSERNLQLLLYAWVIENQWIPEIKGQVAGLFYLSVKDFQRKGFRDNENIVHLYSPGGQNKNANTTAAKQDLLNQFHSLFTEATLQIQAGDFNPKPMDKKNCPNCEYQKLCRAPHLI
jgi:ATP-dependent helicase/DNAse subunit B